MNNAADSCRVGVLAHRCRAQVGRTVGEYAHPTLIRGVIDAQLLS